MARLRGKSDTGRKPLLLLAHIDVVEANKADWSQDLDPFKLTYQHQGLSQRLIGVEGKGKIHKKLLA